MSHRKAKMKKSKLCIYLIKESCSSHTDILKNSGSLTKYDIKGYSNDDMVLYVRKSRSNPPRWVEFFSGALDKKLSELWNSSSSAVLIVKQSKRYFVFTFGYGHGLINQNCIVESFGLKVALNSINPEKIRSVDTKNLDTVLRLSKVQTSQAGSVDNFGMNIDKDILNAVTGLSNDDFLGKQISGSIALHLSLSVNVDNLPALCKKLLEKLSDESYKDNFAWVDHIAAVKDPSLIDELNEALIKAIKSEELEGLFLAVPELVEWERVEGFKYSPSDKELREDIYIADILPNDDKLKEIVSLSWLKRKEVLCVGKDSEEVIYRWSLYDCINYEIKKKDETYILTDGKWYKIDANYVKIVEDELSHVAEYTKFKFPEYSGGGEGKYNETVANDNKQKCCLMDKRNIQYGGGKSKIEFCDLIIEKTDFVHVKRFRGSNALSHLFFQGRNSAFLLLTDMNFLKKVNKIIPTDYKFDENTVIRASNYEVVFAVISSAKGIKEIFPFFSKVSFLQIYKELHAYGYKVSIAKIGIKIEK